jgi:hypothetical protein
MGMSNSVENMEYVCEDASDTQWMYDKASDKYYRIYPDKKYTCIRRESIPDPNKLWHNKIKVLKGLNVSIESLRPTNAIFSLWHHSKFIDNPKK